MASLEVEAMISYAESNRDGTYPIEPMVDDRRVS